MRTFIFKSLLLSSLLFAGLSANAQWPFPMYMWPDFEKPPAVLCMHRRLATAILGGYGSPLRKARWL